MPAGIGGTDLVIGAGVLEANIPMLASNQLLDQLGLVLDMPRSSATFTKLGVTVPVQRNNGHLTVSVVEFSKHIPSDSARWQQLQDAVDWDSPPPELVFLAQAVPDVSSSATPTLHAGDSTDMAARMAPPGTMPPASQAQRVHTDGACCEPRPPGARDLPGRASGARRELRTSRSNLQPPRLCPVRQRVRQVRSLQAVPEEMEVERPRRSVGRTPGQQVRGIAAQFATALAILLQYCAGPCSTFPDSGTIDPSAFEAPRHDGQGIAGDTHEDFDNSGTQAPNNPFYAEWFGDVGLNSMEPSAQPPPETEYDGRRRRLSGNWARSAGVLDRERAIYDSLMSTSCRPPPAVDVMELFAGEAGITAKASRYGLSASEPVDQVFGWHLEELQTQDYVIKMVKRLRPHVLHVAYPCTLYSIFNENLNYSKRMHVLHRLRQDDLEMRRLIRKLLDLQLDGERAFVLENPRHSRLWEMDEFRDLGDFPGIAECIVDSGAYGGTTTDGEPVIKPFKFLTNIPGAATVLNKRLSETERMYTVPVQGKDTKPSQVYPQKLVDALLHLYHDYIRAQDVTRFPLHQALATFQSPVSDLAAWDPIVTMLERSFGTSSTRPFYVDVDSDVGKNIGDLLGMNLARVQCVQTPTQRRLPLDFPFTVRSAFLLCADGSRSVEMEDLSEIQQPKQRFAKAVRYAVFAYGERRLEVQPSSSEGKPDSPMPDLPTDVTFPGLSADVPAEVRRTIARVHINLGHPTAEELVRLACHQGSPSAHEA